MGFDGINSDKLEQSINVVDKEKLKTEIESVINNSKDSQNKIALDAIESLSKEQLANYIESSFKHDDGWDTYQSMKLNPYYGFMVQAALDFLCDKYGDKKFDKDGNESTNGKSIDEWISLGGGIDNKVGGKTQTAVRIAQKLMGINVDGYAGPQFFAKVCAVLKNESISDFKVRGYDNNNKYKYNFDGDNSSNNEEVQENVETTGISEVETGTNLEPLDDKLFNNLKNTINLPEYAWFGFATNPYVCIKVGNKDTASGAGSYLKTFGEFKFNIRDYTENGVIKLDVIISKLNNLYLQGKENYEIMNSKEELRKKIVNNNYFKTDDLGLSDKSEISYKSFLDYFTSKGIKIDTYRNPPKYVDNNLVFDFDPKGVGNCPEYFKGLKIDMNKLIDNDKKYSFDKFKEELAVKINEIIDEYFSV